MHKNLWVLAGALVAVMTAPALDAQVKVDSRFPDLQKG